MFPGVWKLSVLEIRGSAVLGVATRLLDAFRLAKDLLEAHCWGRSVVELNDQSLVFVGRVANGFGFSLRVDC